MVVLNENELALPLFFGRLLPVGLFVFSCLFSVFLILSFVLAVKVWNQRRWEKKTHQR